MADVKQRYERILEERENQKALKIELETNLKNVAEKIQEQNQVLAEYDITYDTIDDLEELLEQKQQRVEDLLTTMEERLNINE